jgi:pimeloyl-ACP methyl ester carboxylesterase
LLAAYTLKAGVPLLPAVGKLKLVKMDGSGHFIAEEKPADTIAAIEAFLD